VCAKQGCGKPLLWCELGPLCGKCLRDDGASPLLRMLHLRFLVKHPNAALVAALHEMADYLEVRALSKRRASAPAWPRRICIARSALLMGCMRRAVVWRERRVSLGGDVPSRGCVAQSGAARHPRHG
jgi:hypothetical protein